jgi:type IV pilus assembly protein PilW
MAQTKLRAMAQCFLMPVALFRLLKLGYLRYLNWVIVCSADRWIVPAARAPGAAAGAAGNGTEVRDFKVWFGVDTNITPANIPADFGCGAATAVGRPRDCIADTYVRNLSELITPATPTPATPDQIKTVRVCLVLRSEAIDGSVVRPTPYKDCDDANILESQTDRKLYRTFVTTVLMKNLKDR